MRVRARAISSAPRLSGVKRISSSGGGSQSFVSTGASTRATICTSSGISVGTFSLQMTISDCFKDYEG